MFGLIGISCIICFKNTYFGKNNKINIYKLLIGPSNDKRYINKSNEQIPISFQKYSCVKRIQFYREWLQAGALNLMNEKLWFGEWD